MQSIRYFTGFESKLALSMSSPLTTSAIRIAAASLGAAVAGPLGGALGAVIGNALGPSAAELVSTYTDKFGEEVARKLLDTGTDSLLQKLKQSTPNLESAYRQALCLSLSQIHPRILARSFLLCRFLIGEMLRISVVPWRSVAVKSSSSAAT
jgi:hypothetical protein